MSQLQPLSLSSAFNTLTTHCPLPLNRSCHPRPGYLLVVLILISDACTLYVSWLAVFGRRVQKAVSAQAGTNWSDPGCIQQAPDRSRRCPKAPIRCRLADLPTVDIFFVLNYTSKTDVAPWCCKWTDWRDLWVGWSIEHLMGGPQREKRDYVIRAQGFMWSRAYVHLLTLVWYALHLHCGPAAAVDKKVDCCKRVLARYCLAASYFLFFCWFQF